ncbi:MAG: hypothetical protein ABL957_07900 [Parvularculaceae bacterium]
MKKAATFSLVCFASILTIADAAAATVSYTRIAATGSQFVSLGGNPSINNNGILVFSAGNAPVGPMPNGGNSINVGSGAGATQIAESLVEFSSLGPASINDQNQVIFRGQKRLPPGSFPSAPSLIYVNTNGVSGAASSIPSTSGNINFSINDTGDIAFAELQVSPDVRFTVNRVIGGATGEVVNSDGELSSFGRPIINNAGDIIFRETFDPDANDNQFRRLTLFSKGEYSTIADAAGEFSGFGFYALNDVGAIAFEAALDDGGSFIYLYENGVTTPIFDSSSSASTLGQLSINNNGDVLFGRGTDGGVLKIFLYSGGSLITLLSSGDVLDGLVVQSMSLGADALNDKGEFAFGVRFSDFSQAIYRGIIGSTSAVPLPAALPLFLLGVAGLAVRRRAVS